MVSGATAVLELGAALSDPVIPDSSVITTLPGFAYTETTKTAEKNMNGIIIFEKMAHTSVSKHPPPKVGAFKIVNRSKRFVQKII
jgi:hypothetical protein